MNTRQVTSDKGQATRDKRQGTSDKLVRPVSCLLSPVSAFTLVALAGLVVMPTGLPTSAGLRACPTWLQLCSYAEEPTAQPTHAEDSPTACLSRSFTSRWLVEPTDPSRLRISERWSVTSLPHLTTELTFSPVALKPGWDAGIDHSVLPSGAVDTEETNATTTSVPWGSGDTTKAGRTFLALRSVNGNGTSTAGRPAAARDPFH